LCCLAVVAGGCGTLLGITPDDPAPDADSGMPSTDASSDGGPDAIVATDGGDGGAADAADAGPMLPPDCTTAAATDTCTLATGIANLGTLAVGNGYVYFAHHEDGGAIQQVPTGGGVPGLFASGGKMPAALFASPAAIYWVTSDALIARKQWDAATPQTSVTGSTAAGGIVAVGPDTYFTIPGTGGNGTVQYSMATLSPGNAIVTAAGMPTPIAADAAYVYYASRTATGSIARVAAGGGTVTKSPTPYDNINAIALSTAGGGFVAFTSEDGVFRAPTTSDSSFTGQAVKVSPTKSGVGLVADDNTGNIFVLTASGTLETIANLPPPAASGKQVPGCSAGTAIAQDVSNVYVACGDTIIRVSKIP
jgi:hypothetical protein